MGNKGKQQTVEGLVKPGLLKVVQLLLVVAVVIAVYLTYFSLSGKAVAGCGPESGCDKVLGSKWSKWFGAPVSLFAVVVYGAALGLSFRLKKTVPAAQQRAAWTLLLPCAALMIGAALWFAGLQIVVLKSFCAFCLTAHACATVAGILLLSAAPYREIPQHQWQQEKQVYLPRKKAYQLLWPAIALVAVFAVGQLLYTPKNFTVTVMNGAIKVDFGAVPVIGRPDAPHKIVSLFDYTCHYCRTMHGHLFEAFHTFSNEIAIANLPMPLSDRCNYTVKRTPPAHTNACEYARLGLAVWRAKPSAMAEFDEWVFKPEHPPPLEQTREFAEKLVGPKNLGQALQDSWIESQLKQNVDMYATNYYQFKNGSMPQVMIGTNLISLTFRTVEDLYTVLEKNFGLKPPKKG